MALFDGLPGIRNMFPNWGNTPPAPDSATTRPPVDQRPAGGSGRANFGGFIQWDEFNAEWIGGHGLALADMMWRTDADIKRDTLATWSPITSASWSVEPYGGDQATDLDRYAAELCEHALWNFMRPNIMTHLAELGPILIRSGYTDFEQIWKTATYKGKKVILPKKLDLRLPRTIWKFYQDDDGDLTGVVQFLPNASNVWIPASELLHYRLQAEGDNWTGTSMYRHAWKHFYFKEKLERIDAIGQERKAVGLPVVFPPDGASEQTKDEMETILANVHTNEVGFIIMPGPKAGPEVDPSIGWDLEVITFDSSSGNGIKESIEMQTLKIAGAFIADFLELGHHQVGARATAEVQEDPFMTAIKALSELIIEPLNELCARIATLNVPGIEGTPKLSMSLHDEASLSELSTYAQQLYMAEMLTPDPATEDFFRERADMPPADPVVRREHQEAQKAGRQMAINGENGNSEETDPATEEGGKFNQAGRGSKIKRGPGAADKSERGITPGSKSKPGKQGSGKAGDSTVELDNAVGSAPWYEDLLSQGRLKEALDNARETMETATKPAAVKLAATMAARARSGRKIAVAAPPADLQQAFENEMLRLYELGRQTVADELAQQHHAMGTDPEMTLDAEEPEDEGQEEDVAPVVVKGHRRLKRRAMIAAEHVANEVAREAERSVLAGERSPLALQRQSETAAERAIRREALTNASPSINDGRRDAAAVALAALAAKAVKGANERPASGRTTAQEPQRLRGIYTSVLDNRTCGYCEGADDGVEREPEDPALQVPNPECDGGEFCRCMVVWVLDGAKDSLGG